MQRDRANDKKGFKAVKWVTGHVEGDYVKNYNGLVSLLTGTTSNGNYLLNYLVKVMDDRNRVRNTTELKKKYRQFNKKNGGKIYSDTSINRAFKELSDKNILYKLKRLRGLYRVNPQFFSKNDEDTRIKLIRYDLEKKEFYAINTMRALTYDADMERKKVANGD